MSLRLRVSLVFLVHGLVVSTWVSRIAEIQKTLGLSPGTLGTILLAAAVGSLVSMPVTGWLIDKEGSGRTTLYASLAFCLSLPLLSLASSAVWLSAALFVSGAAAAAMDISMNAQAVAVEERHGRSIMSSFHALFSAGGMAGAMAGGFLASRGVSPPAHFLGAAALFSIVAIFSARNLIADHAHPSAPSFSLARIPRQALSLAAIAFIFFMIEGAMGDWDAIYLREFLSAGVGTAALGYAAFSLLMLAGRMVGDVAIGRMGRTRTVRSFSLVAAAGLALATAARSIPLALAGFGLVGAGCSVIVPVAFAGAGRIEGISKGAGMAAVSGAGYAGLLLGPPLIGFTAQGFGLRVALALLVLLAAMVAGFASERTSET
jgi:MFS family permease